MGAEQEPVGSGARAALPGEVRQLGYVVRDIEAAMTHWTTVFGVGPFFYFETARIDDFRFRGEPCEAQVSTGFANVGVLQIELIQLRNDARSSFKEFLDAGHEGLQHIAFWTTTMDADLARAEAAGLTVQQSGFSGGDPEGRHVYFETAGHSGTIIELSEVKGFKGSFFRHVADAAATWDGSDPVRRLD